MAGEWSEVLHEASWGGVRFDAQSLSTQLERVLAVYKYHRVDGAKVVDMGGEPRLASFRLFFSGDDARQRFSDFVDLVESGTAHTLIHPIFGTWSASPQGPVPISISPDEWDCYSVEVNFIEATASITVLETGAGAGRPPDAGLVEVEIDAEAAEIVADEYAAGADGESFAPPSAPQNAVDRVQTWADEPALVRDVEYGLADLQAGIDAELAVYDLDRSTRAGAYALFAAYTELRASTRRAADGIIATSPKVITITVASAMPLISIAAQTYGAHDAAARCEELAALNTVPNPFLVPAGTVLRGYAATESA